MPLFPTNRSLFAERVTLKLIEASAEYQGVCSLTNLERARRLGNSLGQYRDVEYVPAIQAIKPSDPELEVKLLDAFWLEFGSKLILRNVEARINFYRPSSVKANARCDIDLGGKDLLSALMIAPFKVKGMTNAVADEICIFDNRRTREGVDPFDLRYIDRFLSMGTTITFYHPAGHHLEWYNACRSTSLPPSFVCDKKLVIVVAGHATNDIDYFTFGIAA